MVVGVGGEVEWLGGGGVGVEQPGAHRAPDQLVEGEAGGRGGGREAAGPGAARHCAAAAPALGLLAPCGRDGTCEATTKVMIMFRREVEKAADLDGCLAAVTRCWGPSRG